MPMEDISSISLKISSDIVSAQEAAVLPVGEKDEKCPLMALSPHPNNGRGWIWGNSGLGEEVPDLFPQQDCNSPPHQTFNFKDIGLKPFETTFPYPKGISSIEGRDFFMPTIRQWSLFKKLTGQNSPSSVGCGFSREQQLKSQEQQMNSQCNSSPRPLPPVPQFLN